VGHAEVILFSTPTCAACRDVETLLAQKQVKVRVLDVSADREALVLLLRFAGSPTVPTVVAYGEVMVGFDAARLDQMLEGLEERAETWERVEAEEEEQLRESERTVRAALEQAALRASGAAERPERAE
jgi:glutaredoxin 3